MSQPLYRFSGLDGVTGRPLLPDMTAEQLASQALGRPLDEKSLQDLRVWLKAGEKGVGQGVDERDLAQTGWGVIYADGDESVPDIRRALSPLLELRQRQAGAQEEHFFREFIGRMGYRSAETKQAWLARQGAGSGPADPENVPYYLLIVGSPELIPYRFQYQLDVQYAVGRIHFESLDDYARYAKSVAAAESAAVPRRSKRAVFFAPRHEGDAPTDLASRCFVAPLAESLPEAETGWKIEVVPHEQATKSRLGTLLGGDDTPSLLLTVGHGVGFPSGDPRQLDLQGELVCADWPSRKQLISQDACFAAKDIASDARLSGLIAFHFACFSAGTPDLDDFTHEDGVPCHRLAPKELVSRLPQRLLSHGNGGALAVVGHIEKAWEWSFYSHDSDRPNVQAFTGTFKKLLAGYPIGAAMEFINVRYAELASDLGSELEEVRYRGKDVDASHLAQLWIATNDSRNYAVVGDPAVRLKV